ncbi:hypothetical protein K445DRAFT_7912 [Daldinia sp. EC12]|nr:hypothetical protein K445DRAFT_7912 [Daldinia sp. EC12]
MTTYLAFILDQHRKEVTARQQNPARFNTTMASGSESIGRGRFYLADPDESGDSDHEAPVLAACQLSIEHLFNSLPLPTTNDTYQNLEQDSKYKKALEVFLEEETGPADHDDECRQLKSIATKVLNSNNPHGIRVAFIEGLVPIIIEMSKYDAKSAKLRYFAHAKWILQGRKNEDAYEDGDVSSADSDEDRDVEYSHLPKSITTQKNCAYCNRKGRQFSCIQCVQYTGERETTGTGYCRKLCEVLDREDHKAVCIARYRFWRGARFMKTILMVMENQQTTLSLESSYEQGGMIFLEEKPRYYEAMQGGRVVHRCTWGDEVETEHVKEGLFENIEQYTILVKNAYRPIVRKTPNGDFESNMLRPHTVFCVTLVSGEKYAVDYAGGRYGWNECVMRWEHFAKHRLHRVIRTSFPGDRERDPATMVPDYLPEKKKVYIHMVCLRMAMSDLYTSLHNAYPDANFNNASNDSIDRRMWNIIKARFMELSPIMFNADFLAGFEQDMGFKSRMYLNPDFEVWVENHDNDGNVLKRVWFPEELVNWMRENVVEDAETLQEIWNYQLFRGRVRFKYWVPSAFEVRCGISVFQDSSEG